LIIDPPITGSIHIECGSGPGMRFLLNSRK
jgi:hypothetical protein